MNRLDGFQQQFEIGQEKEREILNIFRRAGWIGELFNFKSFGDLWVIKDKIPYVIEVKNEDNFYNSGNILLELYQGDSKKPSGLSICEAQICIHTLKEKAAIYRTQPMRLFLKKYGFTRIMKYGKSDNKNLGGREPIKRFLKYPWFELCQLYELSESKVFTYEF